MDPVSHHDQEEDGDKRCSRCLQLTAACVRCLLAGTDLALL
jgi:hypothetical protein